MENLILISAAFELLRSTDIVSNESDFSVNWLGHSESYVRTLRFKKAEPSIGSLAICASRLRNVGEKMLRKKHYRHIGLRFITLSEQIHEKVNKQEIELKFD